MKWKIILCLMFFNLSVFSQTGVDYVETKRADLSYSKDRALIQKYHTKVKKNYGAFTAESADHAITTYSTQFLLNRYQNDITTNAAINNYAYKMAFWFITWFGGVVMLLSLLVNLYNNVIKGRMTFDWGKLGRDILLFACLYMYIPVFGFVNWMADGFPWMIQYVAGETYEENTFVQFQFLVNNPENGLKPEERKNVLDVAKQIDGGKDASMNLSVYLAMQDKIAQNAVQNEIDSDASGIFSMSEYLKRIYLHFVNMPTNAVISVLMLLAAAAKMIVFGLVVAMDKFHFVVGPLAILFSFVGIFKDKWITWLTRWLMLKCVLGSIIIVDYILLLFQNTQALESIYGTNYTSPEYVLFVSVIGVVMYCLVFWLTSSYIGSADTGKFLSAVAGAAMGAVGGAASKMSGLGGGSGGGAGSGGENSTATAASNIAWQAMDNPDNINR